MVIKVGEVVWTFKEVQDYFQIRLKGHSLEVPPFKSLKKELLNEIFLRSFIENWAKKNKKKAPLTSLSPDEKLLFSKEKKQVKALKAHRSYLSLYNLFLKELSKQVKTIPLKTQKDFYNKNKKLFSQAESCHLKQILVKKEQMAQTLYRKIKQGEAFEKLSQIYSLKKDPGWIQKGELEVFDQACFYHKETLSPVLKSPYGYHIFFVEERKASQQKSFPKVQKQILKILTQQQVGEQFQIWLKKETSQTPVWTNKKLLNKIHIQYKNSST